MRLQPHRIEPLLAFVEMPVRPKEQGTTVRVAKALSSDRRVTAHRSGREVRYTVREERLDQARAAIARTAARWDKRLTVIKKMAEQAPDNDIDG